ncbi:MAG: ArsC family transcriptional regulator [Bacteroidales bacterium 45-6]|nr:MAG: ArsC family transcriptional regulator [Bacteroidales bacterium 45-6]
MLLLCYPKCGTCQKAIKWLNENKITIDSRNIAIDNPSKEELASWIERSGLPVAKFFNTSGLIYKERNLKEKVKTAPDHELIDLLSENGMLVKRPLLVAEDFVLVGFKEEDWKKHLK